MELRKAHPTGEFVVASYAQAARQRDKYLNIDELLKCTAHDFLLVVMQ